MSGADLESRLNQQVIDKEAARRGGRRGAPGARSRTRTRTRGRKRMRKLRPNCGSRKSNAPRATESPLIHHPSYIHLGELLGFVPANNSDSMTTREFSNLMKYDRSNNSATQRRHVQHRAQEAVAAYLSQASSLNLKPEAAGTSRGVSATARTHMPPPAPPGNSRQPKSCRSTRSQYCHTARLPQCRRSMVWRCM